MSLTFTAENHIYRVGGVIVPSVTQIIKDAGLVNFDFISDELLAAKADLGNKVHSTIELNDHGTLDVETLHILLKKYLDSWIKFKHDFNYTTIDIELQLYHPLFRYAGRIDQVGETEKGLTLLDIKSGKVQKTHPIQTAGYAELFNYKKPKREQIKRRLAVYLTTENYKVIEHKESSDRNIFLAALTIANYHKRSNK